MPEYRHDEAHILRNRVVVEWDEKGGGRSPDVGRRLTVSSASLVAKTSRRRNATGFVDTEWLAIDARQPRKRSISPPGGDSAQAQRLGRKQAPLPL